MKCLCCTELIVKAVECGKCQHIICCGCARKNKNNCIYKCGNKYSNPGETHLLYKKAFANLSFNCPNSCDKIIGYDDLVKHLSLECPHKVYKCTNYGCQVWINDDIKLNHEKECEFYEMKC